MFTEAFFLFQFMREIFSEEQEAAETRMRAGDNTASKWNGASV